MQATNIRNVLLRGLRDGARVDTGSLGKGNFVYTAPTISSLADLMMRTIDHKPLPPSVNSSLSSRVEKMMQMAFETFDVPAFYVAKDAVMTA